MKVLSPSINFPSLLSSPFLVPRALLLLSPLLPPYPSGYLANRWGQEALWEATRRRGQSAVSAPRGTRGRGRKACISEPGRLDTSWQGLRHSALAWHGGGGGHAKIGAGCGIPSRKCLLLLMCYGCRKRGGNWMLAEALPRFNSPPAAGIHSLRFPPCIPRYAFFLWSRHTEPPYHSPPHYKEEPRLLRR